MTDKKENLKKLDFLKKDGTPFVFDHKTTKLYAMADGKRREITDSKNCARIRLMATIISEKEAKRLSFHKADKYWEKSGLLTLLWRWIKKGYETRKKS